MNISLETAFLDRTMLEYNGIDAMVTHELITSPKSYYHELANGYQDTYDFTMRLHQPLMYMMTRGVNVSRDKLNETKKQVLDEIAEKQEKLNELCGRVINPKSADDCKKYFYLEKNIQPYTKTTGKGASRKTVITIDDKALQRLARGTSTRKPMEEAKLVQDLRGLHKLYGTYLDIDFDEDGRLRCFYKPRGTKFGRLSSTKTIFGTGMNMQNLPGPFKRFLIADPGYMMFEIDKAKAEWVVVAYLSGDPNMIKVIEEGIDPHIHTIHLMTHIDKEIIKLEEERVGHLTDAEEIYNIRQQLMNESPAIKRALSNAHFLPRTMSLRQCGKKSNHGLNYDEGYRQFALTNEMPENDAKNVIHLYKHVAYPNVPKWHQSIQNKLQNDRMLENCFGRKYKFLGKWDSDLWKAAYAFLPQSTVGDLVNWGIIYTYEDVTKPVSDVELLGQVHDSVMGQYPVTDEMSTFEAMSDTMHRISEYMNPTMEYSGREFTIDNDLKVGLSWGEGKTVDIHADREKLATQIKGVWDELKEAV